MAITRTYPERSGHELVNGPRARHGGPRAPRPAGTEELFERFVTGAPFGSHMPLDTDAHWDWRNPLNLIPALILVLIVIAIVAMIV